MQSSQELYFPNITALIKDVKETYSNSGQVYKTLSDCLHKYIRMKKYWPMIQIKQFKGDKNIVLLHNSYKRDDVKHFKELYDEVRSVVLDLTAIEGTNIVVSLADKTPIRLTDVEYEKNINEDDICEFSYEGTMIYVYNHNDKWFFGTTTCPSMDDSMFFHPKKTHGMMFDEYLDKIFNTEISTNNCEDDDVVMDDEEETITTQNIKREMFCQHLNKDYTYGFMLVHYENRHIMDYSQEFGNEYKELFHIFTREKINTKVVEQKLDLPVRYIQKTKDKNEALETLRKNIGIYSLMITNKNSNITKKVSLKNIIDIENENIGNSNVWMNMLHVYSMKKNDFKINNYINKYLSEEKKIDIFNIVVNNQKLSPTYIIDTTMKFIAKLMNYLYTSTTSYDIASKKYTINLDNDRMLLSNMRYHMAQLRDYHKKFYCKNSYLEDKHFMRYLCNLRLKDIRLLIQHINKENYYQKYMEYNIYTCIDILQMKLKEK